MCIVSVSAVFELGKVADDCCTLSVIEYRAYLRTEDISKCQGCR